MAIIRQIKEMEYKEQAAQAGAWSTGLEGRVGHASGRVGEKRRFGDACETGWGDARTHASSNSNRPFVCCQSPIVKALPSALRAVLQEQEKLPGGGKGSRQLPSDCWDGRLRAQGVSGAVGKGRGQVPR